MPTVESSASIDLGVCSFGIEHALNAVDLIKLDIEGAEPEAFAGATERQSRHARQTIP